MNTRKLFGWALLIALLVAPVGTAFAKEVGSMTISGPGIQGTQEITDRGTLLSLNESMLSFAGGSKTPPAWITDKSVVYEIGRNYVDGKTIIATEHIKYYPHPEGEAGVMLYEGMEDPGFSSEAGKYFPMQAKGETALNELLTRYGATLPTLGTVKSSEPQAVKPEVAEPINAVSAPEQAVVPPAPASAPAVPQTPWALIGTLAALLAALGGYWLIRSRRVAAHSTAGGK